MPITPLHFGILAPINHFAKGRVSNVSFILSNLWMDFTAILYWTFSLPLPEHTPDTHSFLGALGTGMVISLLGISSRKPFIPELRWVYGAFLGAFSHILLDMLVHAEMVPMYPITGNPFYMGWMEPLSIALLPLTIWFTVQCVSGSVGWIRQYLPARRTDSSLAQK